MKKVLSVAIMFLAILLIFPTFSVSSVRAEQIPPAQVYFNCSFAKEGAFRENESWSPIEPSPYKPELGTWHWVNSRNGFAFPNENAGKLRLIRDPTNSTRLCLMMLLDALNPTGNQHCKLYECQSAESYAIPAEKGLYYSAKYYFPADFKVEQWRVFMQWGNFYPEGWRPSFGIISNIWTTGQEGYLFVEQDAERDPLGQHRKWNLGIHYNDLPKDRWVDLIAYIKPSTGWERDGIVKVTIDGKEVCNITDICTAAPNTTAPAMFGAWGIGNYGGRAERGYILVKDVVVSDALLSTEPINENPETNILGSANATDRSSLTITFRHK